MTILVAQKNLLKTDDIKGISSTAPNWVKDLYKEMTVKFGKKPDEAVNQLRRSPFFEVEWILKG